MLWKYIEAKDKLGHRDKGIIKPDYYITSKPKGKDEVRLRRCFRYKEKKMGKFERYCSVVCRNQAKKYDNETFKVSW